MNKEFVKNWLNRIDDFGHMTLLNALWFNDNYQKIYVGNRCTYTEFIHYYQVYIRTNEDSSMNLINKLWECVAEEKMRMNKI